MLDWLLYSCLTLCGLFGFIAWKWGQCSYSEGWRTGRIIKLAYKGCCCKTWEGELDLYTSDKLEGLRTWQFSVPTTSKVKIDDLKQAMETGKLVTLTYKVVYLPWPWKGDSVYQLS